MILNSSVADIDDLSCSTLDKDVYREFIQQFHESSIQRYGIDSEQTRMFKMHLAEHAAQD